LVRDRDIVARTARRSKGKLGGKGDILFSSYRHRGWCPVSIARGGRVVVTGSVVRPVVILSHGWNVHG
jgi:hypothetical protein